jgi:pimeloyl-ACP methyl ester carboxylesterase
MYRRLVPVLSLVVLAAACGTAVSVSAPSVVDSEVAVIAWADCEGPEAPEKPFQCATVSVPLDYLNPTAGTIDIAVVRYPADNPDKRAGAVFTNPGGPGASGIDFVIYAGREMADSLELSNFDIVGFDPRGVDRSGGLRCSTDAELDKFQYVDDTPDTPEEEALFKEYKDDESTCEDKLGKNIRFYSTENTARDMDQIRAAMRLDSLHFVGISYGTYLGGVYATLFPNRVSAMVLDSAFDPQGDSLEEQYTTQLVGFEKAFNNWVQWCQSETECEFRNADVASRWDLLYNKLDKTSLVGADKRDINHRVMNTATRSALYSRSSWSTLARALLRAEQGDGVALLKMADQFKDRNDDGTYKTSNDSFYIIRCASGFGRQAPKNVGELIATLKEKAPWAARRITVKDFDEDDCEDIFDNQKLFEITYKGSGPIVVVGGEKDPATPMRWAEEMTSNLGSNASLVRFTGEGHSQLLVSRCVDLIATAVLVEKQLPKNPTVCDPDVPVKKPTWWAGAVQSVDGVALNSERMFPYYGLKKVDVFAEARAVQGSVSAVWAQVSKALETNGFAWKKDGDTDVTKKPQFFVNTRNSNQYVGVLMSDSTELQENKMYEPDGIVPRGSSVVLLYYFPE